MAMIISEENPMTALRVPLSDADTGWQTFPGTVRVRVHPLGSVQLQVSTPHGDGTFDVATLVLDGALRDIRNSATQFPAYGGPVPTPFVSTTERDAERVLAATNKHAIRTSGGQLPPSVSGHSSGN